MQHLLIVGLGHFGYSLVKELAAGKIEITVIEELQERADLVKDLVSQVIVANAASKDLLAKFTKNVDCAIVCISERIDSSVLITYRLKGLGIKKIIAKATSKDHGEILRSIGADEIIYPEEEAARRIARGLTSPNILDVIKLSDDFDIVELPVPDLFVNKTIKDLQLRNRYHIDILAVKNPLLGEMKIMPPPEYQFRPDEVMIFIGESDSAKKLSQQ